MTDVAAPASRTLRRVTRRLRRRSAEQELGAALVSLTPGPLGELVLEIVVSGARPGPVAIGELRERGRWSLVPFTLTRRGPHGEGTLLSGSLPVAVLDALVPGRYDVSVTFLAGRRRHRRRVAAPAGLDLPNRPGLAAYVTSAGNLSLRRSTSALTAPAPVGPSVAGVDSRSVHPSLADLLPPLTDELRRRLGPVDTAYRLPRRDTARFEQLFPGLDVSVDLALVDERWQVGVHGRSRTAARFLRNVLVGPARMELRDGDEVHLLAPVPAAPDPRAAADELARRVVGLLDRFRLFLDAGPRPEEAGLVPAQWWDAKANFGDVLGPMLIEHLSGRPAINVRSFPSEDPGLFTVGSIAAHLQRPGARVWGSGVIGTLSATKISELAQRAPRSIHAVRGSRTRAVLRDDLGWEVPEVYGDPALLLPRYYTPRPAPEMTGRIALVPHYMHLGLLPADLPDEVAVVDVRQGPEIVIDQIAAARACISSSLHGLVIAQAWEVPWTWMRAGEKRLHGDTFKFEDFFTVLDRDRVSSLEVGADDLATASWADLATASTVPTSGFDADRLVSAFPEV